MFAFLSYVLTSAVMEGGDLEYLVKNNFTKLPHKQQQKIKSDGRPMPKFSFLRTMFAPSG